MKMAMAVKISMIEILRAMKMIMAMMSETMKNVTAKTIALIGVML